MAHFRHGVLLACGLAMCGAGAGVVGAAPVAAAAAPAAVSMDEAVKMAEGRFHARVIRAQTEHQGARTVYVLRLLNDSSGRVWTVHVDATNGAII